MNQPAHSRSKLIASAERELSAYFCAVAELFGPEEARRASEDWLQQLVTTQVLPTSPRQLRLLSINASAKLAKRVSSEGSKPSVNRGLTRFVGLSINSLQPGQAFHANYATSCDLFKNLRLGFNGYWLQQLINHQIDGVAILNSKERTVGLGPGIQLGGRGIWFRVNSYMETDVRNCPKGIEVTLRISKTLTAKELTD